MISTICGNIRSASKASSPSAKRSSAQFALVGLVHHRPEDCGGPEAYMEKMDHHRWDSPLDEVQLIAEVIGRVLNSQVHERIRDVLGDVDLEEAVDRLEAYERFRPDRFDRRRVNRRLKQYALDDEGWRLE